jgi:hypothetical protein
MEELSQVTSYLRSMAELEKNTEKLRSASSWGVRVAAQINPKEGARKTQRKRARAKARRATSPRRTRPRESP